MIQELVKRYPVLDAVKDQIEEAYKILETCYENGGKLLIAGNGGSAADSDHIVGELMKGFVKRRPVSMQRFPPHSQMMWTGCFPMPSR